MNRSVNNRETLLQWATTNDFAWLLKVMPAIGSLRVDNIWMTSTSYRLLNSPLQQQKRLVYCCIWDIAQGTLTSYVEANLSPVKIHTLWVKNAPSLRFSDIFPKRWEFLINFLHTYCTFISTLDCKFFIQLSPILTKLSHTKRYHPSNFWHFTRTELVSWLTEQMTSMMTSCHIQHVCWHYKNSRSGMTRHRQR